MALAACRVRGRKSRAYWAGRTSRRPPTLTPLDDLLEELKTWANYPSADKDTLFKDVLRAAYEEIENEADLALFTQTLRVECDRTFGRLQLPRTTENTSLVTLSAVSTFYNGTETTEDTTDFVLEMDHPRHTALRRKTTSAAWSADTDVHFVRLAYQCGYGSGLDDVPDSVRLALKQNAATRLLFRFGLSASKTIHAVPEGDWRNTLLRAGLLYYTPF